MLIVLKYGGNAMAAPGEPDPLLDDVAARVAVGDRVVLVHGGGPQIDAALAGRSIESIRIEGQRVTDDATLAITESVLCGTVNKALVRSLARRGVAAVGICGQDGGLLEAVRMRAPGGASLGHVGEIVAVKATVLEALLARGFVPVVAPLGLERDTREPLNVNADASAGAIAGALRADAYVAITNVDRVRRERDDPATGIDRIGADEARTLLETGVFAGGMRPKIVAALAALDAGARTAVIAGSGTGALRRAIEGNGTTILRA